MRVRHSILFIILAVAAAVALTGCSAGTQNSAEAVASAGNAAPANAASAGNAAPANAAPEDGATFVQVQSIDGNTITAVVGTMPQGAGGSEQSGAPQGQPSGDIDGSQPQGTPAQQPSGDSQPGGGRAGDGQLGGMGFTAGDETITFTVGDATVISAQSGPQSSTTDTTKLTVADIAVGDVLAITLSSDNVAESIVIQQSGTPGEANGAS